MKNSLGSEKSWRIPLKVQEFATNILNLVLEVQRRSKYLLKRNISG